MAGPGDGMAGAAGRGRLRASHADREQVIDTLKASFVQGRLSKDELDMRVGQALASRTYADLDMVSANIPAGVVAAPPSAPARAQGWRPITKRVKVVAWSAWVIPLAGLLAAGNVTLFVVSAFALIVTAAVAWGATVETWEQRRSRGQLPQAPPPGAGGQASPRLAPASHAGQLPRIKRGQRHTAEAAPRRFPVRHCLGRGQRVAGALAELLVVGSADRRAISVQLAGVMSGQSRLLRVSGLGRSTAFSATTCLIRFRAAGSVHPRALAGPR
jgi:hypothetical protein